MKKCRKLEEPPSLETYREAHPQATWEELRKKKGTYRDIKSTLLRGQRCLCAYCEIRIADGMDDEAINNSKQELRVEHFHPKADQNGDLNWALHWPTLWAVCHGGSKRSEDADSTRFCEPLPENLSCDAFKNYQTQKGKLPEKSEGFLLAPDEVPAFPLLFQFTRDGTPEAHATNCASVSLPNHPYPNTATLVSKTIEHLNLGCPRLNRARGIARDQLEKQIKRMREQNPNDSPETVRVKLARRYFSNDVDSPWPPFFTLIRWRLGEIAERYLREILFDG